MDILVREGYCMNLSQSSNESNGLLIHEENSCRNNLASSLPRLSARKSSASPPLISTIFTMSMKCSKRCSALFVRPAAHRLEGEDGPTCRSFSKICSSLLIHFFARVCWASDDTIMDGVMLRNPEMRFDPTCREYSRCRYTFRRRINAMSMGFGRSGLSLRLRRPRGKTCSFAGSDEGS
jgi:hypothetical protein